MARTNTYTCKTCGKIYEFCLKCQVVKPSYDAGNFCCKEHADIYAILARNGYNSITAEKTLKALSAYNLDEITLAEDVAAYVEQLKSEVVVAEESVKTEESTVSEEMVVAEASAETKSEESVEIKAEEPATPVEAKPVFKSNKKNKKKW